MSEAPMGALHDSTNTNGSQGGPREGPAAMNGGGKDGHATNAEAASTQAARKGKKDGKRKEPALPPSSPQGNGKAKVKRSRELAALQSNDDPPVAKNAATTRPSRAALSKEEQDKAEKASRSARAYAPLPYQLKRLFFRSDPGEVKIAGRTLQLVHKHPHIYQILDFMTEGEYDYMEELIDQQYGRFRASYTDQDVDTKVVDSYRTSAFIPLRKGGDKAVRQIEMRAAEILGLSTENVEPLQMVGYRQHDKFDLHHDMGTYDDKTRTVEAVSPRRLVTFFLYLNNLPEGEGHTVFPSLKVNGRPLSSQPQRLKALLWCNVLENGEPDTRLIHRADPCREEGSMKFGINVWVTDKNLQALALSTSGAVLNPAKKTNKRSILSMLDEPCEICGGRREAEKILLCDHCDRGYHMHCLDPPLKKIPTTAWMCPDCEGRKPRKGEYCEECEGGENEHRMVLCDTCDRAWHTYCLEPKLPRVPKDDWHCARCVRKREGLPAIRVSKKKKSEEEKALLADPDYRGCVGCGKKDQLDTMLVCDSYKDRGCTAEWHMHCLTPTLKTVPEGDWFCPACASAKAEDEAAALKEEARLKPHDYVLLPPTDEQGPAQLACITQVSEDERRVSVRVALRSTQAIRQGVKFSLPLPTSNNDKEVSADTVLGKVRVEVRGPWVFVDTTSQPLARQHLSLPTPTEL